MESGNVSLWYILNCRLRSKLLPRKLSYVHFCEASLYLARFSSHYPRTFLMREPVRNLTSLPMTHTTTARPNFTWSRGSIPRAPGSSLDPLGARLEPRLVYRDPGPFVSERGSHLGRTSAYKGEETRNFSRTDSRRRHQEGRGTWSARRTRRARAGRDWLRSRIDCDWSANTRCSSSSHQRMLEKGD